MADLYDAIGRGYRALRRQDPRIAAAVLAALADVRSVVNVGAGAGSYEPRDRRVVAVEPSRTMIRQRAAGAAPVVRAVAGALPFRDGCFEAALAILTIHHWPDRLGGLEELRRTSRRRVVILTWDPAAEGFWPADYFPQIWEMDRHIFPSMEQLRRTLGRVEVRRLPIQRDCLDGFLGAYWQRPQAYLEARVRTAISAFWKLPDVESGLARLREDLASGQWQRRYARGLDRESLDIGYRLVVAT